MLTEAVRRISCNRCEAFEAYGSFICQELLGNLFAQYTLPGVAEPFRVIVIPVSVSCIAKDLGGGFGEVVERDKPVPDCGIKTRR